MTVSTRDLQRSGVTPEAGKMLAMQGVLDIGAAKAAAGAATGARKGVELQGYARKMDAANLGRGLASSQATSAGVALNAGNSAVGNAQAPVAIGQQAGAGVQGAFGQAMQGNASAGSLYNMAAGNDLAYRKQNMDFTSSMVNGSSDGSKSGMAAFMKSDENVKDGTGNIMSPAKALGALVETPVHEDWTYSPEKGGPDDGRIPHDGVMAQDAQATMGDKVAPGGKMIDPISMMGVLTAGIQGLHQEVQQLAGQVKQMKTRPVAARGVM